MKKILILGAGLVSRPMVRYLLDVPDFEVTVASRTVSKAQELVGAHQRGRALALNVDDDAALGRLVSESDLAVSLLPYTYHVKVANHCLKHRKPLVTTSYVSDAMRALDGQAKAAGVILLNEIGLDPGIDHMSAMKIIHDVQKAGGKVASFMSYCGGLPAPEANDNPLGYKFSWSPKGVVMAGRNDARYLKDGKEVFIPGPELFGNRWPLKVADGYEFEAYPNRNSLPYIETYGLKGVGTMLRGTLRNPGWCATLKAIADLGVLKDDSVKTGIAGLSPAGWLRGYVPGSGALRKDTAAKLGLQEADRYSNGLPGWGCSTRSPSVSIRARTSTSSPSRCSTGWPSSRASGTWLCCTTSLSQNCRRPQAPSLKPRTSIQRLLPLVSRAAIRRWRARSACLRQSGCG
jgi:saccharopine dehydrogenase-like NADP-dependent oxidoreductase